jgi:hypothetical protein
MALGWFVFAWPSFFHPTLSFWRIDMRVSLYEWFERLMIAWMLY